MREETIELVLGGGKIKVKIQSFEEKDRVYLRKLYDLWRALCMGMERFKARKINLPEGISEPAFCIAFNTNCVRVLNVSGGSGSFDVLDRSTGKRIQVKATSVENELTSFGPRSVWDELYFLDFYRDGKFDGTFVVYKIPNDLVYNHKVNATQTFRDQQAQKRRPRFSIKKEIISPHKIKPERTCKI